MVLGILALVVFGLDRLAHAGVAPHGPWCVAHRHHHGSTTACKSNLKNIGTALEMYSTDNQGRFPPTLSLLTPNYLKSVPTCPSIGIDTYSGAFVSSAHPDTYTIICRGHNHRGVGLLPDFPQYSSPQGLIDRP